MTSEITDNPEDRLPGIFPQRKGWMKSNYVVGETYPGYSYHLREIGDTPVHYGGHVKKPLSLCGRPLAWDTHVPVDGFDDCAKCLTAMRGAR